MARVTVEDCIQKVKNRFELVLMAAERTKDLEKGAAPTVMRDNDKSTIVALREIADETISLEGLKKLAKRGLVEDSDMSQENSELSPDENIFNIDADESYEDEDDDEIEEDIETDEAVDGED